MGTAPMLDVTKMTAADNMTVTSMENILGEVRKALTNVERLPRSGTSHTSLCKWVMNADWDPNYFQKKEGIPQGMRLPTFFTSIGIGGGTIITIATKPEPKRPARITPISVEPIGPTLCTAQIHPHTTLQLTGMHPLEIPQFDLLSREHIA